jgi:hypothetical protein
MDLTPEQQAESDRIFAALQTSAAADLRALADLLAAKPTAELLGATELQARDLSHAVAAKALASALEGRKKGATSAPAPSAPAATAMRASTAGSRAPS